MYSIDNYHPLRRLSSRLSYRLLHILRRLRLNCSILHLTFTVFIPNLIRKTWKIGDFKSFRYPWYHDFEALGVSTPQDTIPTYRRNQELKSRILFPMIDKAILLLNEDGVDRPKILEYFAADSFFGLYALSRSPEDSELLAVDLGAHSGESQKRANVLSQGLLIAKCIGLSAHFKQIKKSVFEVNDRCALILNIGGLYHIEQVEELIRMSSLNGARIMIIQTVVHEDRNIRDFFESPAPNWTWGSRFSASWIRNLIMSFGWKILDGRFQYS